MEYNIVLLPKAITDFEKSVEWYNAINSSLAKQFSQEIEATIKFISKHFIISECL